MGRTYVITPVDITNILRLPTGTTIEVNTNPDLEKFKYWSIGPEGHELLHRPDTDGYSVSLGPEELKSRKYGLLQAIYFKRKQSYTSKQCLREILTADELSLTDTGES